MPSPNQAIIDEFRQNQGRVGGRFANTPLLLLTTVRASNGREHVCPVTYLDLDGDIAIFATNGGADHHPHWYFNLVANPSVKVELGTDKYEAEATVLQGEERATIYRQQAMRNPNFARYEQQTQRLIPVIVLAHT